MIFMLFNSVDASTSRYFSGRSSLETWNIVDSRQELILLSPHESGIAVSENMGGGAIEMSIRRGEYGYRSMPELLVNITEARENRNRIVLGVQ